MRVGYITSIVSAVLLAIVLKGLSYFHFVRWNPVKFLKDSTVFEDSSKMTYWVIFVLIMFVLSFGLFVGSQYLYFLPAGFTSLLMGVIIGVLIEWKIYDLPPELTSFKKISIPFIVVIIMFCRFIMETAGYHYKMKNLEGRKKLPYKSSVIK